jgi:hypothetical protein
MHEIGLCSKPYCVLERIHYNAFCTVMLTAKCGAALNASAVYAGSVHCMQVQCTASKFSLLYASSVHCMQVHFTVCKFSVLYASSVHCMQVRCNACKFSALHASSVHSMRVLCAECRYIALNLTDCYDLCVMQIVHSVVKYIAGTVFKSALH